MVGMIVCRDLCRLMARVCSHPHTLSSRCRRARGLS